MERSPKFLLAAKKQPWGAYFTPINKCVNAEFGGAEFLLFSQGRVIPASQSLKSPLQGDEVLAAFMFHLHFQVLLSLPNCAGLICFAAILASLGQSVVKQEYMEQASRPLVETAELEEREVVAEPPNYFWNVKPVSILHWGSTHKPELALMAGMSFVTLAVSGAALSVLLSPHLGQAITYEPLIDDATLAASRRITLGEQLLGQVARVLEIEIVETQGPEVGHRSRTVPAMTIVAQADKAAPMPEADLTVGLKAMVIAAGVGLGVTGLMRLLPLLPPLPPMGKQRRQPLAQRLKPTVGGTHPLAPVSASSRSSQTLMPGALTSLAMPGHGTHASQDVAVASHQGTSLKSSARRGRRDKTLGRAQRSNQAVNPGQRRSQRQPHAKHGDLTESRRRPVSGDPGQRRQSPHRPPNRQPSPTSFVQLNAFSASPAVQGAGAPRSVLLPNAHFRATPSGQASVPGDMLNDLDVRRQYPLSDRR